ncbi:MAG: CaiB/BaiF CoA-transferase family protein [Anaerolineae bacterium]|nr:CaiB/BaiF CoA-transferase family protein [Anaerolineae bacterium]
MDELAPERHPLRGLRVLDLSMLLPGPLCTMLLADWGADVIKVEPRLSGDPLRAGPDSLRLGSAYFLGLNRNKRSMAIDLRREEGRRIMQRLLPTADVLVEGFRPGKAARLGLGYAEVRALNAGLVYCSLSGYGQDGPWAPRAGHDLNYLALSGLLSLLGEAGGPPLPPGVPLADIAGAFMAVAAILAALWRREREGEGSYLDASLHESSLYWLAPLVTAALSTALRPQRGRMPLTGGWPCYGVYATRDGRHMSLAALEPYFWEAFCRQVGREDWLPLGRAEGAEGERVRAEVAALFAGRTQAEWVAFLAEADCCCEPVLELDEALQHPQARHRGLAVQLQSPGEGALGQVGAPVRMGSVRLPPPRLGEHTAQVLREAGYSEEEIRALVERKVIAV